MSNRLSRFARRNQVAHRPHGRARTASVRGLRVVTEQQHIEAALRRQNDYLDALHETTLGIVDQLDLTAVLKAIITRAAQLLDTPHGFFELVPEGEDQLEAAAGIGVFADFKNRVRYGEGAAGTVWQTARPLVIDDYAAWTERIGSVPTDVRALVAVPMILRGRVIGVLGLAQVGNPRRFVSEEVALLRRFADLATIALENARLYSTVESELRERKRVQESLRASERWFRALIEKSSDGIALVGLDGNIRYVSPSTARLLGYTTEDLLHEDLREVLHPEDRTHTIDIFEGIIRRGLEASGIVEHRLRAADGTYRWFETIGTNHIDDPDVGGIVVNYRDITERKRAEAAMAATEHRFQAMVERSADGIVLFDAVGKRVYVSPSTTTVLGYTPEEHRELAAANLFHPDDDPRMRAVLREVRQKPGMSVTVEARVRHKRGGWRWLEVSYTNLLSEPDVQAIVANYHDISARKEAEQTLHEQHAYLEALHEVSLGLMRRLDPANVLHAIIQRAGELLGTEHGFVDLVTDNGESLAFITGHGVFDVVGIPTVKRGEGLSGIVWETGAPLLVEDYPNWVHHTHGPHVDLFHTVVAVPLMRGTEVVGVLGLAHAEAGRTFNEAAVETLGRFAQLASIALDNARLYQAAQAEVAERRQAETALRGSEARYRLLFEHNPLPMWVYDQETQACFAVNDAAIAHYSYSRDEFLAMPIGTFHSVADVPRLHRFLAPAPEEQSAVVAGRHRKKDGTRIDVEITVHRIMFDERPAYLMLAHDITERKRAEAALRHHALHDNLTDLPNRTLFMERLTQALDRAKGDPHYHFAVLYLDFDRFKNVNDSLGHLHGDQLLVQGAQRLASSLRSTDVLSRLGGDEFVLIAEELADPGDVVTLAQRVQRSLSAPLTVRDQELIVTASIGIVFGGTQYERPEELLRDADIAMYQAKALGRAQFVIFDPAMRVAAMARLQLEHDLRHALGHEELTLVYQPIVALTTGAMVGVEALVRWEHPTRGPIPPTQFIPVAEETGLVIPLDRWVLRTACQQMRHWAERYPTLPGFAVNVNVSGRGIAEPDFVANVRAVLAETGLAPGQLKMEITESLFVEHAEAAAAALQQLQAMGVDVQLDDFGMGYSSLNYVHRFPISRLKIDRSFISGTGHCHVENIGIVQTIIALAHHLGIGVTAEGIETAEQQRQLASLSCDYGQGHRFSPPASSTEIGRLLAREAALSRQSAVGSR